MPGAALKGRRAPSDPRIVINPAAGAVALDLAAAGVFDLTATGNVTLSLLRPPGSTRAVLVRLYLRQDATGSRTWTFPAVVAWDGGAAPSITTDPNTLSVVELLTGDGGVTYQGRLRWVSAPPAPSTVTLSYTGAAQTLTVPAGRTVMSFDLRGASGGAQGAGAAGGFAGRIQGNIAVTAGEVLQVNVGGQGVAGADSVTLGTVGWNGGGTGAAPGGGATDLRRSPNALADRFAVAGAGGGSGCATSTQYGYGGGGGGGYYGGGGAGPSSSAGTVAATAGTLGTGGNGGTTTSAGGPIGTGATGGAGGGTTGGTGANGGAGTGTPTGGAGGTAAAGGAAGAAAQGNGSAAGGGGSNFASATATGVVHSQGVAQGNGVAVLTWS